jgi:hypothetical protein
MIKNYFERTRDHLNATVHDKLLKLIQNSFEEMILCNSPS